MRDAAVSAPVPRARAACARVCGARARAARDRDAARCSRRAPNATRALTRPVPASGRAIPLGRSSARPGSTSRSTSRSTRPARSRGSASVPSSSASKPMRVAERLRQPGRAARDDSIPVPAQHDVEIAHGPGLRAGLEVAHMHRGVGDLDVTGGEPVEVERWPVSGPFAQSQQTDAAVLEAHHRHCRADEAHASGNELAGAQHVPEIERDTSFAHCEHRLPVFSVEDAKVVEYELRSVPAQPRVQARELEPQLASAAPPRPLRGRRARACRRARYGAAAAAVQSRSAGPRTRKPRTPQQAPLPGAGGTVGLGRGGERVRVHISTTSYWSIRYSASVCSRIGLPVRTSSSPSAADSSSSRRSMTSWCASTSSSWKSNWPAWRSISRKIS